MSRNFLCFPGLVETFEAVNPSTTGQSIFEKAFSRYFSSPPNKTIVFQKMIHFIFLGLNCGFVRLGVRGVHIHLLRGQPKSLNISHVGMYYVVTNNKATNRKKLVGMIISIILKAYWKIKVLLP